VSCMRDIVLECAIVLCVLASGPAAGVHSGLAAIPDKCPADESRANLRQACRLSHDPVLLSRGVLLRQKRPIRRVTCRSPWTGMKSSR